MTQVKIKRLSEGARMPERKTDGAAGYDLYVPYDTPIAFGRNVVKLQFSMELPTGWFAIIKPRSGFSAKGIEERKGRRMRADVLDGIIDSDYRGNVGVIVKSDETDIFIIKKGTRIAQMVFQRYLAPEITEVEQLDETERGDGGFGSTGE